MEREENDPKAKLERYYARKKLSALHNNLRTAVALFADTAVRGQFLQDCIGAAQPAIQAADQMEWTECAKRACEAKAECERIATLAKPHMSDRVAFTKCFERFDEATSKLPKKYLEHPTMEEGP